MIHMFTAEELGLLKIAEEGMFKANNAKDKQYAGQSHSVYGRFCDITKDIIRNRFSPVDAETIINAEVHCNCTDYIEALYEFIQVNRLVMLASTVKFKSTVKVSLVVKVEHYPTEDAVELLKKQLTNLNSTAIIANASSSRIL